MINNNNINNNNTGDLQSCAPSQVSPRNLYLVLNKEKTQNKFLYTKKKNFIEYKE